MKEHEIISLWDSLSHTYKALKDKDWSTFAKLYNGPEYAKNKYDSKLSSAYLKYIL